jgi:uncharacterized protein (TIGR03435 family)
VKAKAALVGICVRSSVFRLLLVVLILEVGTGAFCQVAEGHATESKSSQTFDVVAIHLHTPAPHERSHIVDSSGRFITVNVDLKSIIQWAFDVPASRIVAGPAWINTQRFDIEAKSESALDTQPKYDSEAARLQKRQMVQALLADRFQLVFHHETRELPIFALEVLKTGQKFQAMQTSNFQVNTGRNYLQIEGGENTMTVLAESLAEIMDRVVVDKTGILGKYKVNLKWTPDDAVSTGDEAPPSIFTALQEQLGLKLESQKGPVGVFVIDKIEMPSEN